MSCPSPTAARRALTVCVISAEMFLTSSAPDPNITLLGLVSFKFNSVYRLSDDARQAVDRPAARLRVTAWAPNGVVEGLELEGPDHWVLGAQWHPERSYPFDRFSRRIFGEFLARCRAEKWRL